MLSDSRAPSKSGSQKAVLEIPKDACEGQVLEVRVGPVFEERKWFRGFKLRRFILNLFFSPRTKGPCLDGVGVRVGPGVGIRVGHR